MSDVTAEHDLGRVVDLMRDLWALDHGLRSVSKRLQAKLGVTGAQRVVLLLIGQLPRPAAADLAQRLSIHRSTLAGILARLERRELITRHGDPNDGRRVLFELSEKGRQLIVPTEGTIEAAVRHTLAEMPIDKVDIAQEVLQHLSKGLTRSPR